MHTAASPPTETQRETTSTNPAKPMLNLLLHLNNTLAQPAGYETAYHLSNPSHPTSQRSDRVLRRSPCVGLLRHCGWYLPNLAVDDNPVVAAHEPRTALRG